MNKLKTPDDALISSVIGNIHLQIIVVTYKMMHVIYSSKISILHLANDDDMCRFQYLFQSVVSRGIV